MHKAAFAVKKGIEDYEVSTENCTVNTIPGKVEDFVSVIASRPFVVTVTPGSGMEYKVASHSTLANDE